jgi:hypothetical protein
VHVYQTCWNFPGLANSDDLSYKAQENISLPGLRNGYKFLSPQASFNLQNRKKLQYKSCESIETSSRQALEMEYNVTDRFRFVDNSVRAFNQQARGFISVERGNSDQTSDILITMVMRYAYSPGDGWGRAYDERNSTFYLHYTSTNCTDIEVRIFLRPDTQKHLNHFEIQTKILNVNVDGSLSWTVDNVITHTSHGRTEFEAARFEEPMITHNVASSSITGEIFGFYVADGNLTLANEKGAIGVCLIPRVNSDAAIRLESIQAKTDTGDIHVQMWADWEYWPMQPFTHTTYISSQSGSIWAATPHGSLTNITSSTGDATALMVPFGTDSKEDESWIHTILDQGNLYVHVYNTVQDSLRDGKFDPMLRTRSRHKVFDGNLTIRYPYSWYGDLEGMVSSGKLEFDASRLEKVERGGWWVKATRGQGESFMESWVERGDLDIKVGLGE